MAFGNGNSQFLMNQPQTPKPPDCLDMIVRPTSALQTVSTRMELCLIVDIEFRAKYMYAPSSLCCCAAVAPQRPKFRSASDVHLHKSVPAKENEDTRGVQMLREDVLTMGIEAGEIQGGGGGGIDNGNSE